MTDRTMMRHLTEALRLKAEIASLKAELEKHETAIKHGMVESGSEVWQGSSHKVTYRPEAVQMRFSKSAFVEAYSSEAYEALKRPVKQEYFRYI